MKEKLNEIIRHKCCEKWDRRGNLPNPQEEGYFIEIKFCSECGNQLRDLNTCPYGKTDNEEIIACVLEKEHSNCYKRRLFTRLLSNSSLT